MSQDDFSVELILESIDNTMVTSKQPKVLMFDIGGVCVSLAPDVVLICADMMKGKFTISSHSRLRARK